MSEGRGRGLIGVCYVFVAGMLAVAVVRLFQLEVAPLTIGVQGITAWLLLPAYAVLVVAVFRRRLLLGLLAGALAVLQLFVGLPTVGWNGPQSVPEDGTFVRILTSNVTLDNSEITELGDDLAQTDADLVVLLEVTPEHVVGLQQSALWETFGFRALYPHEGYFGTAIFSRLPLTASTEIDVAGSPMVQATVATDAGAFQVIGVHAVAPVSAANIPVWRAQHTALARLIRGVAGPVILAGDFNSTLDHAPMQRLLSGGLSDAHTAAGGGLGATWPQWRWPFFPVMSLDHVLVNDEVTVVSASVHGNRGSDHRRLQVDISLPTAE